MGGREGRAAGRRDEAGGPVSTVGEREGANGRRRGKVASVIRREEDEVEEKRMKRRKEEGEEEGQNSLFTC